MLIFMCGSLGHLYNVIGCSLCGNYVRLFRNSLLGNNQTNNNTRFADISYIEGNKLFALRYMVGFHKKAGDMEFFKIIVNGPLMLNFMIDLIFHIKPIKSMVLKFILISVEQIPELTQIDHPILIGSSFDSKGGLSFHYFSS